MGKLPGLKNQKERIYKMAKWHIWAIHQHKFDKIKKFMDEDVKEVEDIFFPTVLKERKIGSRIYKKRTPLYHGYLFLKYDDEGNFVYQKIRSNPFITTYVGLCSEEEVLVMKKKEEWNSLNKDVTVGDKVEIMCGPLVGMIGTVNAINGNNITIKTKLFGRDTTHVLSADDVEITNKD